MFGTQLVAAANAARRAIPSLGLATVLLTSTLGASVPARAQDAQDDPNAPAPNRIVRDHRGENRPTQSVPSTPDPDSPPPIFRDHRDPYARILLVIKSVIIHNDMDWGDGEFGFTLRVHMVDDACLNDLSRDCGPALVKGGLRGFSGSVGTVKQLDQVVPAYVDTIDDRTITPTSGIPIREGSRYGFTIDGSEWDPVRDDDLGILRVPFTNEVGEVRFGTHTERADGGCVDIPVPGSRFCRPAGGKDDPHGGFAVEYEIRRAPVPDLRIGGLKVLDVPGSAIKLVCAGIQNVEAGDAGPFEAVLHVDNGPAVAKATAGGQAAGAGGDLCIEAVLPAGQHELTVVVDEVGAILEFNERNNAASQQYVGAAIAAESPSEQPAGAETPDPLVTTPSPSPVPGPGAATSEQRSGAGQADLTVGAIKVNGRVPDGKDDCKDGKNAVAVLVKNGGDEKAGAFAVRLEADGEQVAEQGVSGLEAGQEREVRFDGVQLKKGEHTLAATLDAKNTVAESKDDNNDVEVTARCKHDD
jgi:hypothetical protein